MIDKIERLLADKFQHETDFQDCFLIESKLLPTNKLEIYVDSDSGITFEKCRKISRYLEEYIDTEGWLGEKYTLEVSSPGIGRPLKFARQYPKNIGRKVEVKLIEGGKKTGTLINVSDSSITIEYKERIKEGKKKKTLVIQDEISFDEIAQTLVKITF